MPTIMIIAESDYDRLDRPITPDALDRVKGVVTGINGELTADHMRAARLTAWEMADTGQRLVLLVLQDGQVTDREVFPHPGRRPLPADDFQAARSRERERRNARRRAQRARDPRPAVPVGQVEELAELLRPVVARVTVDMLLRAPTVLGELLGMEPKRLMKLKSAQVSQRLWADLRAAVAQLEKT